MIYGNYALPSRPDIRDKQWSLFPQATTPHDWSKDFDVGIELKTKDQGQSGSCGGQAWSYYGEVLSTVYDKIYTPKSAKFIYAQTFVTGGGSAGRDNCKIVQKQGWADEAVLSSYDGGLPPSEQFMERSQDITQAVRDNAIVDEALSYASVATDIDSLANAISNNHGCIIGIAGVNNNSWRSAFPNPPKAGDECWWHWLYCCGTKMINGKKYLKIKNSWGDSVGDNGFQYISEDYVSAGKMSNGSNVIFEAWTLVYNEENRVKQVKLGLLITLLGLYKKLYTLLTGKVV